MASLRSVIVVALLGLICLVLLVATEIRALDLEERMLIRKALQTAQENNEFKQEAMQQVLATKTLPPVATRAPTPVPTTSAPVTRAPVTSAPVTSAPVTSAPVTSAPVTSAPVATEPPVSRGGLFKSRVCPRMVTRIPCPWDWSTCPIGCVFSVCTAQSTQVCYCGLSPAQCPT